MGLIVPWEQGFYGSLDGIIRFRIHRAHDLGQLHSVVWCLGQHPKSLGATTRTGDVLFELKGVAVSPARWAYQRASYSPIRLSWQRRTYRSNVVRRFQTR
jgi:hypothetical protein